MSARLTQSELAAYQALRARGVASDDARQMALDGVDAETVRTGRLRQRLEHLADEFADQERIYRASRHDSYAEGQRDAWDLAEIRVRSLLDSEADQ